MGVKMDKQIVYLEVIRIRREMKQCWRKRGPHFVKGGLRKISLMNDVWRDTYWVWESKPFRLLGESSLRKGREGQSLETGLCTHLPGIQWCWSRVTLGRWGWGQIRWYLLGYYGLLLFLWPRNGAIRWFWAEEWHDYFTIHSVCSTEKIIEGKNRGSNTS